MACYLDCELLDQRKETKEADPEEARDDSRSYEIEEQKKKRWKNKVATFLHFMCVRSLTPAQLDNHEGIIHNIKPI